jgi:predicted nucleic acid-binding protein
VEVLGIGETEYLLDTNVLSETFKAVADGPVAEWFRRTPPNLIFISVVSLGVIHYGIQRLPHGNRRQSLELWMNARVWVDYAGRVRTFEARTAAIWGELMRKSDLAQGSCHPVDMQLAATAVQHGLVLVTRNTKHFAPLGLDLLNPWAERPSLPASGSEHQA